MDATDAHAMAMSFAPPQPMAPHHQHHLEIRPHIHPNPIPFPSSQPSVPLPSDPVRPPYGLHYQQHQHQHLQMQVQNFGAPAGYGNPEMQKIHTLFIAGLPDDIKPREIHNLFRRCPGFDSCQLKYTGKGNQVVAFATFFNHQSAVGAMNGLNGVTFDPETGATLHVELARSNSRMKRPWGTGAYAVIDKRVKVADDTQETESNDGDGGYDDPSGTDNSISSNKDALAATHSGETMGDLYNSHDTLNEQLEKPIVGEIPPCSTLFIANLGPNCTEEELTQVLSQYTGFHMLKIRPRGGMPVAFADFKEVQHATEAMKNLQGSLLASSDRGGMHLEYARAKMRKH